MGGDVWFELTEDIRLDMLEVCGRGYVIDHCIASLRRRNRELEFRVYVTDALKLISENTAKYVGGSYMPSRFAEKYLPEKKQLSSEEVKKNIRKKIGGKL